MNGMGNSETLDLTVVIPTYNRQEALIRLLKSFQEINYSLIDEFVISDNHSSYSVYETLQQELSAELFQKCRVVRNRCNIGGQGNMNNSFLLAKTKWMWMIGDDDVVTADAIDIISNDLHKEPECAWFKYSTSNINALEDDCTMTSLQDFIDYYAMQERHKGNLVFMSNNIYNMQKLAPYIIFAFDYSYTCVSQILPPLMGLDREEIYVKYRSESICKYSAPDDSQQWNCIKVFLGTSTLEDIPFMSLSISKIQKIKQIFIFWPMINFALWVEKKEQSLGRIDLLKKVYKNFYSPASIKDKLIYILIYIQIKYKIRVFSFLLNTIREMKKMRFKDNKR